MAEKAVTSLGTDITHLFLTAKPENENLANIGTKVSQDIQYWCCRWGGEVLHCFLICKSSSSSCLPALVLLLSRYCHKPAELPQMAQETNTEEKAVLFSAMLLCLTNSQNSQGGT